MKFLRASLALVGLFVCGGVAEAQQPLGTADPNPSPPTSSDAPAEPGPARVPPFAAPILPAPRAPAAPDEQGVRWNELSRATWRFLAIEHGFRLLTEPGTRAGLKGSFFRNYGRSVANMHGWADGDEFYVNYVGHPMQGSVAGYLWVHNDPKYQRSTFGRDPTYWKSRLRATAFMWTYSTQFEIGPVSEATIGAIQSTHPQQGFVDHVITPALGLAWMIGEDAVDRYIVEAIEARTRNRWARMVARSALNPTRTFANVINGRAPWSRHTRAGILSYVRTADRRFESSSVALTTVTTGAPTLAPPVEFAITFQPERFRGKGRGLSCYGGGANLGLRLAPSWQLVMDLGGCKMTGLPQDLSGDSLTYMIGPRWLTRIRGGWNAHLQVLVGGNKISQERMYPEQKKLLEAIALRDRKQAPSHDDYTEQTESHAFTVATGGGVNYRLNRAISIRVADISYRHNWTAPLWGRDFGNSLKVTSGLVLRMGEW
jgi:hypothetical protein